MQLLAYERRSEQGSLPTVSPALGKIGADTGRRPPGLQPGGLAPSGESFSADVWLNLRPLLNPGPPMNLRGLRVLNVRSHGGPASRVSRIGPGYTVRLASPLVDLTDPYA